MSVRAGDAACAAHGLGLPSKRVRAFAQHFVWELLRTGVARPEVVRVAIVAAWTVLGDDSNQPMTCLARSGAAIGPL
jgi:hypothetical protein